RESVAQLLDKVKVLEERAVAAEEREHVALDALQAVRPLVEAARAWAWGEVRSRLEALGINGIYNHLPAAERALGMPHAAHDPSAVQPPPQVDPLVGNVVDAT